MKGNASKTLKKEAPAQKNLQPERHPLPPFTPPHARLLMLGSFPPQKKRWVMDFFYPNFQNDMWRIIGLVFKKDALAFVNVEEKRYREAELRDFLYRIGIAIFDTATSVVRERENAADKDLLIVEATDIRKILRDLPACTFIATTGQKATDTLTEMLHTEKPEMGGSVPFVFEGRNMLHFRMPSSSRAYPMRLEEKAAFYEKMFRAAGYL